MALKIAGFRIDAATAKEVKALSDFLLSQFKLEANPDRAVVSSQTTKNIAIIPATPTSSAAGVASRRGGISLSQASGGPINVTGSVVTIDARFAGKDIQYLHVVKGEVVAGPTFTLDQLTALAKANKAAGSPAANASRAAALHGLAALSGDAIGFKKHKGASPMDVLTANLDFIAVSAIGAMFTESGKRISAKKGGGTNACCCCSTCSWGCSCCSAEAGARIIGDPDLMQYLACLDTDELLAAAQVGELS